MFHQGDLQSGIALAQQTSKHIVCFVRGDDSEESKIWEQKLMEQKFADLLSSAAISLKLVQGSVEAGYLTAFVPIQEAPAIVFIGTGAQAGQKQLLSKSSGVESVDIAIAHLVFLLGSSLGNAADTSGSSTTTQTVNAQESATAPAVSPEVSDRQTTQPISQEPVITTSSDPISHTSPTRSQSSQSNTESLTSTSNKKGKQRATSPEPESDPVALPDTSSSGRVEVQTWAQQQRQRNAQAKKDRDRVLAQIEADKKARKEREASRKRELAGSTIPDTSKSSAPKTKKQSTSKTANIQVRLLSGSTIRKAFTPSTTASELRPWIDKELRSSESRSVPAYRLKHIPGPPEPARTIDVADEKKPLADLNLLPSATLIVELISGSVDAYGNSGQGWRVWDVPVAAVGLVAGAVGGVVGWATGYGGSSQNDGQSSTSSKEEGKEKEKSAKDGKTAGKASGRVRTVAEMRADSERESTQLYNGNQLNFQSGEDEDDK